MSRHSKTKKRLFYLLAGTVALTALAGGGAMFRLHVIKQRAEQGKTAGLASMARHDYASALPQLGKYLSRNPNDLAILLPYATARRMVPEPNGRHLGQAISLFQRVLELSPGNPEAQNNLLELYYQVGYNTEALSLADNMLKKSPEDANALHIKVLSLMRIQKLEEAETNALRLTAITPLDLDAHMLVIRIMVNRGNQGRVVDYAGHLAQAHPGDVRFDLLMSIAASVAGDSKTAISLVTPLVTRPQADALYTRVLVRQLDGLELFSEAFAVLQQASRDHPDRELMQLWVRRLFETNRLSTLIEQTAALDPSGTDTDIEIMGMRALALCRTDHRSQALELLDLLEKRGKADAAALHWASALRLVTQPDGSDPVQTIKKLQEALAGNSSSPILMEELGDAYAAAGAGDKASAIWREVARAAPSWSSPLVRASQSMVSGGRPAEALAAAKAAQRRAPEDRDVLMSLVLASAANLREGPSPEATQVLQQIAEIKLRFPAEFELMPMQAGILAQTRQRDAAIEVIRAAVAANPAMPEPVLLSLAGLSDAFKLDQEEACFEASQKAHGLTADLAFNKARWLRSHQHATEGLALMESAHAGHPDDLRWRSTWATYLDLVGDGRAKGEWIALGDDNPRDVKVQWAALSARSVLDEHDFEGRTIDRLNYLIGDDSLTLRLVRARWLLQGQSAEKEATEASIILSDISRSAPEMTAPRLLLATSYMRLGNVSGAIDQLAAVSDIQPDQAGIALELARLLQSRGDFTRARQYIDRATGSKSATPANVRLAAGLLALQGQYTTALGLLEKSYAGSEQQPPDVVLAALYRQLNQPQKADAICVRLLEKPDAASISFCADFYATQNRLDDARHALTLLDTLKLPPGSKELILANFATRHGTPAEALKQYRAAVQAAPGEAVLWQQLVAYCMGSGDIEEALVAADQAAQKLAAPTGFEMLRQNAALAKDAARVPGTRQLLMMLSTSSTTSAPLLDALRTVVTAQQQKEPARMTAGKLRQLADRNPRILPLQTITLQYYMEAGQTDEAVSMATSTIQSFPAAVEPLRLATGVLGAAQHWDQALGTAKEWRRVGTGEALDADLAIASAELHLGQTGAASQQIQPYLERAMLEPDRFSGVILLRAQALLDGKQPEQAEALLAPLLAKSASWRSLWMNLAVRRVDDARRAQAWLEQVGPLTQSPGEKAVLAEAWMAIGKRWNKAELDLKGRDLLQQIVRAPDAPLNALLLWGTLCESSSDLAGAERAYRQALQRDPASAVALNNLAFVLAKSAKNLEEARQYISKAVGLFPNEPAFLDTRATVLVALKDYSGAVSSLKDAQRLDPQNLEWHVNLLAVLIDSEQMPAARTEMQQISNSLATSPNVSPEVRKRYESLRTKLQ